jgi:hypothetical protein
VEQEERRGKPKIGRVNSPIIAFRPSMNDFRVDALASNMSAS